MKPQNLQALCLLPPHGIFDGGFLNAILRNLEVTDTTVAAGARASVPVELVRCRQLVSLDLVSSA